MTEGLTEEAEALALGRELHNAGLTVGWPDDLRILPLLSSFLERHDAALRERVKRAEALAQAALKYDAAIQRASAQGKSWVNDGELDALYSDWLDKARAVLSRADARLDIHTQG